MPSKKKRELQAALSVAVTKAGNRKRQQIVSALKAATPVDTGAARDGWRIEGKAVVNDVPYISALNEGSSPQAPAHFVELAVLGVGGVTPNGVIVTYPSK